MQDRWREAQSQQNAVVLGSRAPMPAAGLPIQSLRGRARPRLVLAGSRCAIVQAQPREHSRGTAHLSQALCDARALPPVVRRPLEHGTVCVVPQHAVDVQRLQAQRGVGRGGGWGGQRGRLAGQGPVPRAAAAAFGAQSVCWAAADQGPGQLEAQAAQTVTKSRGRTLLTATPHLLDVVALLVQRAVQRVVLAVVGEELRLLQQFGGVAARRGEHHITPLRMPRRGWEGQGTGAASHGQRSAAHAHTLLRSKPHEALGTRGGGAPVAGSPPSRWGTGRWGAAPGGGTRKWWHTSAKKGRRGGRAGGNLLWRGTCRHVECSRQDGACTHCLQVKKGGAGHAALPRSPARSLSCLAADGCMPARRRRRSTHLPADDEKVREAELPRVALTRQRRLLQAGQALALLEGLVIGRLLAPRLGRRGSRAGPVAPTIFYCRAVCCCYGQHGAA